MSLLLAPILAPLAWFVPWVAARRQQLARQVIRHATRLYLRLMCGLGLMQLSVEAPEWLDRPGQLVVANHPTLLDALILMSLMPNATFIVKAAMARNPITCWMVALAGYIPNDEVGVELVARAAAALKAGETLMIFPEGTRTQGDSLTLKRGAANIALAAQCPLLPVAIDCHPLTLRKQEPWYRIPVSAPHFRVRVLVPIVLPEVIDQGQPVGLQARALTALIHSRLSTGLEPRLRDEASADRPDECRRSR